MISSRWTRCRGKVPLQRLMADICQLVLRSIRRSTYDRRDHNDLSKPGANNCYLSSWHPAADEFLLWDPHWPLGSSLMISLEAIALESGTIIQSFKYCDSELRWYAFLSLIYLNRCFAVGLLVRMFLCFHGTTSKSYSQALLLYDYLLTLDLEVSVEISSNFILNYYA